MTNMWTLYYFRGYGGFFGYMPVFSMSWPYPKAYPSLSKVDTKSTSRGLLYPLSGAMDTGLDTDIPNGFNVVSKKSAVSMKNIEGLRATTNSREHDCRNRLRL
jgi:hypothetical protein